MKIEFNVKYADGLVKKGIITDVQFNDELTVWLDEMKNTDGDQLIVLKAKVIK